MPTTNIVGGNFSDAEGNPVSYGNLLLELPQDAMTNQPSFICAGVPVVVALDGNGDVLGNSYIWPVDQLTPNSLLYTAWVQTNQGAQCWGPHKVYINSSPIPFNISVWSVSE